MIVLFFILGLITGAVLILINIGGDNDEHHDKQ